MDGLVRDINALRRRDTRSLVGLREVPEFYCRSWSGFSTRWVAYVECDKDYEDKFELLGPVSINGKPYRCTGVLISVMNHRTGQQLFKGERIGLEVESHAPQKLNRSI